MHREIYSEVQAFAFSNSADKHPETPLFRTYCLQQSQSPRRIEWDGLVSKLHRNSEYLCRRSALASSLDTSGRTDKTPVPIQSCRIRSVRMVMFLAPTRSAWSV